MTRTNDEQQSTDSLEPCSKLFGFNIPCSWQHRTAMEFGETLTSMPGLPEGYVLYDYLISDVFVFGSAKAAERASVAVTATWADLDFTAPFGRMELLVPLRVTAGDRFLLDVRGIEETVCFGVWGTTRWNWLDGSPEEGDPLGLEARILRAASRRTT